MENLLLPEIDFSLAPEFHMPLHAYWSLKNISSEDYITINDVFNRQECLEIIKIGKSFGSRKSRTGDGRDFSDIRKSMNSWLPPCEITHWIFTRLQETIFEVNKHYEFDLHSIENLQFTEYNSEYFGNYSAHVDKFPYETQPNNHRKLSFSVQITEPTKYEGGDLLLYKSKEPILANKNLGSINFFPSYLLHEVTPVTKGIRYSLVSWISGPKFK